MELLDRIRERHEALTAWRHHIHSHPELAYEEKVTSDFVAEKLAGFGLEVHRGLGVTGVVGTLRAGNSDRAIGLRADMDALPIQELNEFEHRSRHEGLMHACGHDGHTTMLLGAAEHLAANPDFDGVVHFIFQPAEEGRAGAKAMIDDGLFDLFPVETVYGMHNWPGLPVGEFAVRVGPQMAASDKFEITVRGPRYLGYLDRHDETGGWLATGDLGEIDSEGYLKITGRKKNMLVSSFGRNISPEWIESEILVEPMVMQCVVVGDERPYCCALILPLPGTESEEVDRWLATVNRRMPDYARVRRWAVLPAPLSFDDGLLTANGRPRRDLIAERYSHSIENLYQDTGDYQ